MRVHELAKELGVPSKDLLERLHGILPDVKNHMSALSDAQVRQIRNTVTGGLGAAPAPAAARTAAAAPQAQPVKSPAPGAVATLTEEPPPSKKLPAEPPQPEPAPAPAEPAGPPKLVLRAPVVVKEFAAQIGMRPNQLIAELMGMNVFASINEKIDLKMAHQIAERHGFEIEQEKKVPERKPVPRPTHKVEGEGEDRAEDLLPRPPVVAFLGHVDHGKTSLLDRIRRTQVAAGEAGGITQHIGAYSVEHQDHAITFLDTPGHAAFTAMRARGANLTDIVVLVIAADDGVMPQTKEAIQHAQAAGVQIMVAINKMDLPAANKDRVLQQLQQAGLMPEEWGGEIVCCPVSAQTGEGVSNLLDMIALQAEVLELNANPHRRAAGYVIEAKLEAGMGPTATVLVRRGTLKVGDAMTCGLCWGRIKALINDHGVKVRTAGPSAAVKCLGLVDVPEAGAPFRVVANDRDARATTEALVQKTKLESLTMPKRASLDDLLGAAPAAQKLELAVIVKADVQGSLEAIVGALKEIESNKVSLKFVLSGVGNVTGNDVMLASASNAIILGFHVSKEDGTGSTAKREGVEIRLYSIIYEMIEEVREAMTGLLAPEKREKVIGHAEVRQIFDISKSGKIAGCMIVDGHVTSRGKARVLRGGEVLYVGTIHTLRRFQNDASNVREGQECGIRLDNFQDFQARDIIEVYDVEEVAQQL